MQMEVNATVLCECLLLEDGFSYGKPVAAYTIYKCLLHWKTLEDERTPVFDKLIHIILSAIEVIPSKLKTKNKIRLSHSYLLTVKKCKIYQITSRMEMITIKWRIGYQMHLL